MNFAVVVIWYNPSLEHVNNLALIYKQNRNICVVDNSSNSNENLINLPGVRYIHNKNLGGIAGGFNRGFDSFSNDSLYVYTFDQDTVIPGSFFSDMEGFIKSTGAKLSCPNFYDINAKVYGKFVKIRGATFIETKDDKTHFCISSGMCISLPTFKELGGFNEELIIDHVDTDFALKAFEKGIDIYFNKDVVLAHAIGVREKRKFLGVTFKPNHHSKVRKYYISRNGTYLGIKYIKILKGYFFLNIIRMIHEYLSVILFEDDKYNKLKAMNLGILHAIRGRLGPY